MTILVVDDQAPVRLVAQEVLRRAGYTVLAADGAAAALRTVLEAPAGAPAVDLVLTDVVMPGTPGPALVSLLREHGVDAPVVYMTGYGADAQREHGVPAGAALITKPFDRRGLLEAVRNGLAEGPDAGGHSEDVA